MFLRPNGPTSYQHPIPVPMGYLRVRHIQFLGLIKEFRTQFQIRGNLSGSRQISAGNFRPTFNSWKRHPTLQTLHTYRHCHLAIPVNTTRFYHSKISPSSERMKTSSTESSLHLEDLSSPAFRAKPSLRMEAHRHSHLKIRVTGHREKRMLKS